MMRCVICDGEGVVGVLVNEKLICQNCWKLAHRLLGVESV